MQSALYAVRGPQLCPLFAFTELTFVSLSAPVGFDLDDATLADLARAWPNITALELDASEFAHIAPGVTLGGLLPLAQHCPQLRDLHIALNASVVPDWESQKATDKKKKKRVRQWRLTGLHVSRSPIVAPLAVAAFLSSVFPKLLQVHTEKDRQQNPSQDTIALHKEWNVVQAALPVLRTVRAEEKYWR